MTDTILYNTGLGAVPAGNVLVTPTGGVQTNLADALATATGGAVSATTLTASSTVTLSPANKNVTISPSGSGNVVVAPATAGTLDNMAVGGTTPLAGKFTTVQSGSFVVSALANFGSITPTGSNQATAAIVAAQSTQLGTAASTTGAVLPTAASLLNKGMPILIVNSGTAAIHIYGNGSDTVDTIAGTTGVTLTNGFGAMFLATGTASIISTGRGTISS